MRPFSFLRRPAPISSQAVSSQAKTQRKQLRRLLCESLEQRALMAVLSVTTVADDGTGSLREAIATANTNTEFDTIEFALPAGPQTITLTSGELSITDEVEIVGPGSDQLTISGNNSSRIFNVQELQSFEFSVHIEGVKLTGGSAAEGGALRNEFASVYLDDVVVTGNSATGNGGGILTIGEQFNTDVQTRFTLILTNSRVTNNTAGGSGGGIYNDKDHVELWGSVIDTNQAVLDGGGVFTQANRSTGISIGLNTLFVNDGSLINNNQAQRNGGGIYAIDDHVEINRATVSNNTAAVDGGGIYSTATQAIAQPMSVYLYQATISSNHAVAGAGGGLFVDSDTLDVNSSTIELNSAAEGGGIFFGNSNANYTNGNVYYSTINGNVATAGAGGGIYVSGTPQAVVGNGLQLYTYNSTISGNRATTQGGGVYVGEFFDFRDYVSIFANTIAFNTADEGGGIYAFGDGTVIESSLIAKNTANTGVDAFGQFTFNNRFESASRYNLVGNGDDAQFIPEINLWGTTESPIDPLIGPLQDNGGQIKTHALEVGSPAIDFSDSFPFDDQRGIRRSENESRGDAGAYERAFDFGDAPSTFPTTLANNGARHLISALHLGVEIDSDPDGRPSPATFAQNDDDDFIRDEDGVVFNFSSTAGFTGSAQVTSSGAGLINAWVDVDGSGTWEPSEQILTNVAVVAGVNLLTFTLPAPPVNAPVSFSAIARFRLSTQADLQPTGGADDGEVEDYAMNITRVILPDGSVGDGYTFTERVQPRVRRAYDPELAYGYNYSTNPATGTTPAGDKFTEVELLAGFGDDVFTIHLYNTTTGAYESTPLATVTAPAIVNFETGEITDANGTRFDAFAGIAGGVDKFRVLGIELAAGLSPNDTDAFPTFLAFGDADNNNESIVNFTMTPLATPVAVTEAYSAVEDNTLNVATGGLLSNDTDRNNDVLTAFIVDNPSHGTVTLNTNGTFTYQPNANFNGNDVFSYRAFDGLQYSDPVSVTISVASVNDAPAGADALLTILEDSTKTFSAADFGFTDTSDSPADALQAVIISSLPSAGSLKLSGTPVVAGQVIAVADIANLTFTPDADANGPAYTSFTFQVQDNGGLANAGVDTDTSENAIAFNVLAVNDAPTITLGSNQTVNEDSGATTVAGWASGISVGPANESTQALTILVSNDNNALFSVQPTIGPNGTLTYTPAPNAYGTATVSVQVKDDGGTANGGIDSSIVQTFVIEVTPVNDAPSVTVGGNQLVAEDSGLTFVANYATFSAGPANESAQTLTITVTNDNNALFSVQPTIAADGSLTYTPAPDANGTATVSVVVQDNGGVANGGVDTSVVKTFSIQVFIVNDPPTFVPGPNPTALEDAGAQTLTGWATGITAGPANESGQTVAFTVTNNNNALFAVQPAITPSGTLSYTPAANANGSATLVVTLTDNFFPNASVQKTVTVSVAPVNDVPSFTKGTNLTVSANAGAQSVAGWATSILAGPANEAGQVVSFTVTNSNNALFAVQPSIAANGTLTFTPATTGNGTATVSVVLKDNGGTANGGVDSSVVQTFTITVNPVSTANRPTASIAGPSAAVRGQSTAFTLSATDADAGDNAAGFLFTINWGDGSPVQTLPAGTLSGAVVNHTFAASGRFTVSVTAKDRTGLVSTAVTKVVAVGAIQQQGNVLVIGGTTGADSVDVFNALGLRAVVNGVWYGPFTGVTSIQVFGQAGNDCLDIDSTITVPATVDGGAGDDKIDGGSANDTLLGGAGRDCIDGGKGNDFIDGGADNDGVSGGDGNDIVLGGAGNDTLYGGNGRDLLIGGLGADYLYGGNDDDILIGGTTSYDTNRTALDAVMLEWTRTTANYATRLAHLRDGSAGGLNGTYRLNTTTVQNDSQVDQLFGEAGADWFFSFNNATTGDRIRDKASTETQTNL